MDDLSTIRSAALEAVSAAADLAALWRRAVELDRLDTARDRSSIGDIVAFKGWGPG